MNDTKKDDPMIGAVLGEDFRIVKLAGFGGFARVYVAEQLSVGKRKVAVKVLHALHAESGKAAVAALRREATYLAMLRSPCFPRVIRTGTTPSGLPYFVMEYVVGRTLEAIVHDLGAMKLTRALGVLDEVCEGLSEMHARDIIHRDIKTGNIIVEDAPAGRYHAKMLDLGSARSSYEADPVGQGGPRQVGSPPYLAPETAVSGATSELSDIYSLGAVAYELVCGVRAIQVKDTSPEGYLAYLRSDQPIPTYRIATMQPSVPEPVEAAIHRALERDPKKRFQSVMEFRLALIEAASWAPQGREPKAWRDRLGSLLSRLVPKKGA